MGWHNSRRGFIDRARIERRQSLEARLLAVVLNQHANEDLADNRFDSLDVGLVPAGSTEPLNSFRNDGKRRLRLPAILKTSANGEAKRRC